MRSFLVFFTMFCAGCAGSTQGQARTDAGKAAESGESRAVAQSGGPLEIAADDPTEAGWLGAAPVSHTMLSDGDGATHLGVWVHVPRDAAQGAERPPMAVSLVVDASGSMAGEKIRHARMAATRMVESLRDGDLVSLYAFDDVVMEIVSPVRLDPEVRRDLLRRISSIRDGGSTNMYDAILSGQNAVRIAPASHPIRRVLLISDGLANVGPSHPGAFADLAAQGTEHHIQVSAIGVGLDYDERTLGALALHSEGRMYHLEQPEQLAEIVQQELDLLAATVATNAHVEVVPAPGVTLDGLEVGRSSRVGSNLMIPIGTLYAGQERELLIRARVDTQGEGRRPLATVRLKYEPQDPHQPSERSLEVAVTLSSDVHAVEQSYDGRVEAMLAGHRASEKQQQAAAYLNEGQTQQAALMLSEAEADLDRAVQAAPTAMKQKFRAARRKTAVTKQKAERAKSRREARGAALESYDDSMNLQGY